MQFPERLENTPFTFEKNLNFCSENWLHLFSFFWGSKADAALRIIVESF